VSAEIILPKIDEAMTKGKILEWKKKEGDPVEKGEVVYVLETEKVTWEVESPASGILGQIRYRAGEEVRVGEVVAYVVAPGEGIVGAQQKREPEKKEPVVQTVLPAARTSPKDAVFKQKLRASPLARKMALKHHLDLSVVNGSGPKGRIRKRDILNRLEELKRIEPSDTAGLKAEETPLSSMRATIARRMTESFQTVPHFYLSTEADAERLSQVRDELVPFIERATGKKVTLTDLLLKVTARALEDHPQINVQWAGTAIRHLQEINLGLAIAVQDGLIVPVIRQADKKSLAELTRIRADFVERAQAGKIRLDEMRGGSMTLTNLGMFDIEQFDPIINPPESCILAVGRVLEKPVAHQGQVAIRRRINLTLAIDHRVLDGASGGRFLQTVKELLERPTLLI
jgi:pyruvate dehydrogenase E2 component (dihydrolipoamide acetyltransferase)